MHYIWNKGRLDSKNYDTKVEHRIRKYLWITGTLTLTIISSIADTDNGYTLIGLT